MSLSMRVKGLACVKHDKTQISWKR